MKKTIYSLLLTCSITLIGYAQAVLPTSSSFTTTTFPTGWTATGTAYYTASGNTPPALKFDGTGDMLTINFASAPGNLTYYLTGNSFSGGTFLVEESANGTLWTTLHTHTAPSAGTYTMYTDVPNSVTRYIRFNYTNKVTGNIGLDDVNIAEGLATPAQEINVQQSSSTIITGGTYTASSPVSTLLPITFSIQNLGTTNTLNISSVIITGVNASDFTVGSFPATVSALGNENLVINFTPSASGTRTAVVTINSDDTDEPAYTINLNGIGGLYATEPTSQPTNMVFSNLTTYRFSTTFIPASGVEGYLVLRKKGSPITDLPVDGISYQRGDAIGASQVVLSSNSTSFYPNNIIANSDYYFAVFSYNGSDVYRNYLITSPLTGNVTTPSTMMSAGMYNSLSTSSSTFMDDLSALVNPHTSQFYGSYGALMVSNFEARDTTGDQRVLTCVYSGENKVYTEPFDWTANGYSREHSYCHNWMPSNPADSPELPEYDDYHHLFPTNQDNANSLRSNYPLGEVVTPSSSYLGCKFGLDANGHNVFEPRDEHKGDVARAIMYMAICYNGVNGNNWKLRDPISTSIQYGQDQDVLKAWHFQDPPSDWEIARNDYVDSLQGNRNPFIDSVDYVCYVNFLQMTYVPEGCNVGLGELSQNSLKIYPVPSKSFVNLQLIGIDIIEYVITDMQGRVVIAESDINSNFVSIKTSTLNMGTYIVTITTPYGNIIRKTVIE